MRAVLSLPLIAIASGAWADIGHIGEVAGHDHWIAAGALGLALGLALWAALKGRKDQNTEAAEEEAEDAEGETA